MPRGVATLDELTARIEALFRRYGAHDPRLAALDDETLDRFRVEVRLLIAEYGSGPVNTALDAMPYDRSFSLH
jgi:hypothetical protein